MKINISKHLLYIIQIDYICTMKPSEFIDKQKPVDVAKALGTKQQTSTRDKERLIKKAKIVEKFFENIDNPLNVD